MLFMTDRLNSSKFAASFARLSDAAEDIHLIKSVLCIYKKFVQLSSWPSELLILELVTNDLLLPVCF